VAEIAEASDKQAKGIEQLNNAVAEIDKVVQRTAASAEESASAAEEMRFQCDMTFQMVKELNALIQGGKAIRKQSGETREIASGKPGKEKSLPSPSMKSKKKE